MTILILFPNPKKNYQKIFSHIFSSKEFDLIFFSKKVFTPKQKLLSFAIDPNTAKLQNWKQDGHSSTGCGLSNFRFFVFALQ